MAGSKKLPENFRSRFQKMLGEAELSEYEECLQRPMEHGLRVNTKVLSAFIRNEEC